MAESFCRVGEIELCYETFGDPGDPAMLLVMGLGTQMLGWHEDLCAELASRGFFVVRYDNRDIGRSSSVRGAPPTTWQLARRSRRAAVYSLEDMAADGVGLLDHLGIERSHVVGVSMGGMIGQVMAARHPGRVRSLASIMSSTGSLLSGQPNMRATAMLLRRPPRERDAYIESGVRLFHYIGSPGFSRDEDDLREILARSYERGGDPNGSGRQLAAILASGDRRRLLRTISAPTVVIHGTADRLVNPSGGRATARAIRGARLVKIEGMGHDLPRGAWPQILGAVVENARRADGGGDDDAARVAA
jgi:pimeloyl-ACP methyl ester carboxylesterase